MKVIMENVIDARNNYTGDFQEYDCYSLYSFGKPKACD